MRNSLFVSGTRDLAPGVSTPLGLIARAHTHTHTMTLAPPTPIPRPTLETHIRVNMVIDTINGICRFFEMAFAMLRAKIHSHGVPCALTNHFPSRGRGVLLAVWLYTNIKTVVGIHICLQFFH